MRTASHAILYTNFVSRASIFALPHAVASVRAKTTSTTRPAPSRESPASTRPPRSRAPCPCSAHHANLRLPRVGLRPAAQSASVRAKTTSTTLTVIFRVHSTATVARTVPLLGASYCTRIFVSCASAFARLCAAANAPESAVGRKRAAPACGRKRLLRPVPRFHGNLPRPLDRHGCAHRALARRIVLHANLRLPRVGFRPAARRRQCARIRRRKEARRASVRAKTTSTTRLAPSRESPASTRTPRSRAPCPCSAHHANLRLQRVGFRPATRCRQCARIRRRKEARRASVRANTTSTTRPALSRESPASTRLPRSREPCPRSARRIARESSSPARRLSPGCAPPPVRPNLHLPRVGFRAAARRRQRAGESGSFRRVAV